jgi:hypothetical protein
LLSQIWHKPGSAKRASRICWTSRRCRWCATRTARSRPICCSDGPHATDRRVRTLWLTPVGEAAVAQVRQIPETVRQEALAHMSMAECDQLLDTLLALCTNLLQPHRSARRILRASAPHAVPRPAKAERISAGQGCGRLWIQQRAADRRDEQRSYNNEQCDHGTPRLQ